MRLLAGHNLPSKGGQLRPGHGLSETVRVAQVITAFVTPATSALTAGQSLDDTANWAAFLNPTNYATSADGEAIDTVVVNYIGSTGNAAAALADGGTNHFSVTVTDSLGSVRTFKTAARLVVHIAPSADTLEPVSETQGSGTPVVNLSLGFTGQALVYTSDQPWAVVSGSTLTIADEVRTSTVRITATNSGGSAFVDLSVTIAAPVMTSGLTLADNGDGTSTIVSISIPSLTLADNGDGTSTIEGF